MTDLLRIGMIGCGEIAVHTAAGIAEAENARHVMLMDIRGEMAKDLGEQYDAAYTTSMEELLSHDDVDAVYIAVPHYLHAPLTMQALEAGKHVLCEKPIATTLADVDAMIAKAEEQGLKLSVAYEAQVDAELVRLHEMMADGLLGRVLDTHIVYRGDKPDSYWHGGYSGRVKDEWRITKETAGGGVLIMNTVHDLNTLRYVTGLEARRVYCEYDTFVTPVEVEDHLVLTVRYQNGAIGTLVAGSAMAGRDPTGAVNRIHGDKGQVMLSRPPQIFVREPWGDLPAGEWYEMAVDPKASRGRKAMIEAFAHAVLADSEPAVRAWDGRAALEIIVAAYRSGETHEPVDLPL